MLSRLHAKGLVVTEVSRLVLQCVWCLKASALDPVIPSIIPNNLLWLGGRPLFACCCGHCLFVCLIFASRWASLRREATRYITLLTFHCTPWLERHGAVHSKRNFVESYFILAKDE